MRLEPQLEFLGNTWKSILSRSNYQLSILFYLEINGNKFFLAVSWNSIFIDSLRNYSIPKIIVNKYKSYIYLYKQKHTGTCGYEPLYCENKCGMKVQRRHLGQHKLGECAKRLVACRYCNKEFVFDTLGAHHAKCGRFPVACPHRCETAVLPREDLEVHLKDHCTTHLLSCTFKDAGCRFKVLFFHAL